MPKRNLYRIIITNPNLKIPPYLVEKVAHAVDNFAHGQSGHGANLEKLKEGLFGLRLNESQRLLIARIKCNGHTVFMPMEVMEKHKYEASLASKPKVLKQRIDELRSFIEQELERLKQTQPESLPAKTTDDERSFSVDFDVEKPANVIDLYSFNNKLIQLNEQQASALTCQLPHVFLGTPGAGKTVLCTLLTHNWEEEAAEQARRQAALPGGEESKGEEDAPQPLKENRLKPVLYITQSPNLVQSARKLKAQASGGNEDFGACMSYREFLQSLPETKGYTILKEERTQEDQDTEEDKTYALDLWLVEYIKNEKIRLKHSKEAKDLETLLNLEKIERIQQEFRLITRFYFYDKDPEVALSKYLKCGDRNTLFTNSTHKKALFKAFDTYVSELKKANIIHPAFYKIKYPLKVKAMAVDEAQDFDYVQWQNLLECVEDENIAYMIDANQALKDSISATPKLIELVKNYTRLPTAHRCPEEVTRAANAWLEMRRLVLRGNIDQYSPSEIIQQDLEEGACYWLKQIEALDKIEDLYDNPYVAFIVPESMKDDVNHLCTERQSYHSAAEIKGLEFQKIILINPLSQNNALTQTIASALEENHTSTKHRSKDKAFPQRLERVGTFFSEVFTIITRVTDTVYIVQDEPKNNRAIKQIANTFIEKAQCRTSLTPSTTPMPVMTDAQKKEGWDKIAKRHEKLGNKKRVELIKQGNRVVAHKEQQEKQAEESKEASPETSLSTSKTTKKPSKSARRRARAKKAKAPEIKDHEEQSGQESITTTHSNHSEKLELFKQIANMSFAIYKEYSALLIPNLMEIALRDYETRDLLVQHMLGLEQDPHEYNLFIKSLDTYLKKLYRTDFEEVIKQLLMLNIEVNVFIHLYNYDPDFYQKLIIDGLDVSLTQEEISPGCPSNVLFLFFKFLSRKAEADFYRFIADNPIFEKIDIRYLLQTTLFDNTVLKAPISPIYYLALLPAPLGRIIVSKFIEKNPSMSKDIFCHFQDKEVHFQLKNFNVEFEKLPMLNALTMSQEGIHILQVLFKANPQLVKYLTSKQLKKAITTKAQNSPFENCSILYFLTNSDGGVEILEMILEHNRQLIVELSGYDFIRPLIGNTTIFFQSTNSFYNLSLNEKRFEVFNKILAINPDIVDAITADTLIKAPETEVFGENQYASPLFFLSSHELGRRFILTLLNSKKGIALARGLTALSLEVTVTTSSDYKDSKTSVLFNLTSTPTGVKSLRKLLEYNPELINSFRQGFNQTAFISTYLFASTPFYELTRTTDGIKFLQFILSTNPFFAKHIAARTLIVIKALKTTSQQAIHQYATALDNLSRTDQGHFFLKRLFELNPELIPALYGDELTRPVINCEDNENISSPLANLLYSSHGLALLSQISKHQDGRFFRIQDKSIQIISKHLNNTTVVNDKNLTLLAFILSLDKGIQVIDMLISNNPILETCISLEPLKNQYNQAFEDKNNLCLHFLCSQTSGQKILLKLIKNNSNNALLLTQILTLDREEEHSITEAQPDYRCLLEKTEVGQTILEIIGLPSKPIKASAAPKGSLSSLSLFSSSERPDLVLAAESMLDEKTSQSFANKKQQEESKDNLGL